MTYSKHVVGLEQHIEEMKTDIEKFEAEFGPDEELRENLTRTRKMLAGMKRVEDTRRKRMATLDAIRKHLEVVNAMLKAIMKANAALIALLPPESDK